MLVSILPVNALSTEEAPSNGLKFTLNDDGISYAVTGIGSCTDANIIIPKTYNELPVTVIQDKAFYNLKNLKSIIIPESVITIGDEAFYFCSGLTDIKIGNNVTTIGNKAFFLCYKLTNINLPNGLTSIDDGSFQGCSSLTSITLPNSIKNIGNEVFRGCAIERITIPTSITTVSESLFYDCSSLTQIYIPNDITSIKMMAFGNCTSLTSIHYNGTIAQWESIQRNLYWDNNTGDYTIYCTNGTIDKVDTFYDIAQGTCGDNLTWKLDSNGTLAISGYGDMWDYSYSDYSFVSETMSPWFSYASSIKTVSVEEGITSIGKCAFYSNTYDKYYSSLISINLPDTISSIGGSAFSGCTALTSITLPETLTVIGYDAFVGCPLQTLNIPASVCHIISDDILHHSSLERINIINPLSNGYISYDGVLYDYDSYLESYTLIAYPAAKKDVSYTLINGAETISDYAFDGNEFLQSVMFPDSLVTINDRIFNNCSALESVTIGKYLTSVSSIWNKGCNILEIIIPNTVTNIPAEIYRISTIKTFSVDDSDKKGYCDIDGILFFYDDKTENLILKEFPDGRTSVQYDIPEGTNIIGDSAFKGCDSLTKVILNDEISIIESFSFENCSSLKEINFPENLTHIGLSAFKRCSYLKEISLPSSINKIMSSAFDSCTSLKSIAFKGTVDQWIFIDKVNSWDYNIPLYTIYCTNGTISKNGEITYYCFGDVDDNSDINSVDSIILARHLAKWLGYETIKFENSDVNLDGDINSVDSIILARHLARWNGYAKLPYTE